MFAIVYVLCNLMNGECTTVSPPVVFNEKPMCLRIADAGREQAKSELPPTAVIMYKCVEFPKPT